MSTRTGYRFYKGEFKFMLKCNRGKMNLNGFRWIELKDLCESAIEIINDYEQENRDLKYEIKLLKEKLEENNVKNN